MENFLVYKQDVTYGRSMNPIFVVHLWDVSQYEAAYPSACNGIQVADGTLLVPTMITKNRNWRSGLLVKKPGHEWFFTDCTPNDGDNECSVYIDNDSRVILDSRTTDREHRKYLYDLGKNSFQQLSQSVEVSLDLKAEITRVDNQHEAYFMTVYADSQTSERENATLYESSDGFYWQKLYRLQEGFNGFSYGNVAYYEGQLAVCFEDYLSQNIKVHLLNAHQTIFQNAIKK